MSPSENDLRAALRDGEDDGRPDVDGLIAHVRGRRAQRRARVLSAAAAVVVVAAAAVGGAALWGGADHRGPKVRSVDAASAAPSHAGNASPGPATTQGVRLAQNRCSSVYPRRPVTGRPAAPSATPGQMFSTTVSAVVVCSYADEGTSGTAITLIGTDATALAASIETASPTKLKIVCPDIATSDRTQLAIIGVTADGTNLPTITTDISIPNCNQPITNGTAVRYAWKPPAGLAARIAALSRHTR